MKILGISGSLRRDSHNTKLLHAAANALPHGVELVEWDGLAAVPPFNEDNEQLPPPPVRDLRDAIAVADALLVVTPEYNSSIPGQLKNAIDWASRPFDGTVLRNKPVAVIGASTGSFGALWAQAETRKILGAAGARVTESELPIAKAHEAFRDDGRLKDDQLHKRLQANLAELIATADARAKQVA